MAPPEPHGRCVRSPRPRDVPAYARAKAAGLIPHVPLDPPPVSIRPTASRALRDVAVAVGLVVVAVVGVMVTAGSGGRLSGGGVVAVLSVSAIGALALALTTRRWRRAQLVELQRGYTTTTFTAARFWVAAAPDGPVTNGRIQWDWDATWVLRPNGEVVSPPSGEGDPPGLYPSPRRADAFELWTGHQWTGYVPRAGTGGR